MPDKTRRNNQPKHAVKRTAPGKSKPRNNATMPVDITQGAPVTGKETLSSITFTKDSTTASYIKPFRLAEGPPVLKKYAELYDSYKVRSMQYRFVSDEASTRSGNISMGVDYGTPPTSLTREGVCKLTPHYTGPIKRTSPWMTVSPKFFNSNLVRYTKDTQAPFNLCLIATGDSSTSDRVVGAVEVRYRIDFLGLRP